MDCGDFKNRSAKSSTFLSLRCGVWLSFPWIWAGLNDSILTNRIWGQWHSMPNTGILDHKMQCQLHLTVSWYPSSWTQLPCCEEAPATGRDSSMFFSHMYPLDFLFFLSSFEENSVLISWKAKAILGKSFSSCHSKDKIHWGSFVKHTAQLMF